MSHTLAADLAPYLDKLAQRSVLDREEQRAILNLPTYFQAIRARHDFSLEYRDSTFACFVVSGLVARFGQLYSGARQITALHIPGDMADLHSTVRPVGIGGLHALSNVTILRVPHDAIRRVAARYPAVAEAFWRDCTVDAAILMDWIVNIGRRDARPRLAHIFCEMAVRYAGADRALTDFEFPINQQQLGEASGLTPVHVNRTLKLLRDDGLVSLRGHRVQIADWEALVRLGEFDSRYLYADTGPDRQRRLL